MSAVNGLEAVEMYQADPDIIKVIFMGMSVPIVLPDLLTDIGRRCYADQGWNRGYSRDPPI